MDKGEVKAVSVDKMHRRLLCGTAILLALTLAQNPTKLVATLNQQAGLVMLPLLFPMLMLTLRPNLTSAAREDLATSSASWGAIFRWAILLPVASLSPKIALSALALGLFWAWSLPVSLYPATFSTMDEPWLKQLLEPETKRAPQFSLALISATWIRLSGFGFSPVISGLALATGTGRPLWATGIAACLADLHRTYFNFGSAETVVVTLRSCALILLALPFGCWLVKVGLRNLTQPRQLHLNFEPIRNKGRIVVPAFLLLVVLVITGSEFGFFFGVSLLAMSYSLLARSSVGLLLFPVWRALELVPSAAWPLVCAGLLSGVIGAVMLGELWALRRSSLSTSPNILGSSTLVLVLLGMLFLQTPQLARELTSFPSAGGDWLAWLFTPGFSPLLWFFFCIGITFGILSGRNIYIYLAWGLLLPAGWGRSLLIGSGLAWFFSKQAKSAGAVGKGLIVGDILASLLLLLS